MIHTWSISVAVQFYFIFPILLSLIWKFSKIRVLWILIFISFVSLVLSEINWRKDLTQNFYFFPTRAWEFLAGSIVSLIFINFKVKSNNLLSITGLILILISIFTFKKEIPIPSIYALMPVIGTALVLLFTDSNTKIFKLLSNKFLVKIRS